MNSVTRGKWLAALCLVPFALFFIVFQIAPLVWVLINSPVSYTHLTLPTIYSV